MEGIPELITVKELCAITGVSAKTIYNKIWAKILTPVGERKVGEEVLLEKERSLEAMKACKPRCSRKYG